MDALLANIPLTCTAIGLVGILYSLLIAIIIKRAPDGNEKMVEIAPEFSLGQNNLASAYYNKGDYQKAIEHLDKAVALGFEPHPEFAKALEPHR